MDYAQGTRLVLESGSFAWRFVYGRAMCPDGIVRAVRFHSGIADTFFSVPASVKSKGKTISGYVTVECVSGSSVVTDNDPAIVRFVPYQYGKNANVFSS